MRRFPYPCREVRLARPHPPIQERAEAAVFCRAEKPIAGKREKRIAILFLGLMLAACPFPPHEPASPLPDGWIPLFDGMSLGEWKITNFGGEGDVEVRDGQILLDRGEDLTGITWTGPFPRVNYEVSLEAMRRQGNDFFCGLTFPIQDSHASLIVAGWAGSVVGLSSIDGRDALENETRTRMRFENNRWYRIRLRVTRERIEAWIEEKKLVDLSVGNRSFEVRPEMRLSRPLGLAAWRSRAAFRDLRYRTVSG